MRLRYLAAMGLMLVMLAVGSAQQVSVSTAHGKVLKADKESLTIQPRDDSGKYGKAMTLKVAGTSRITTLVPQMRDKKQIMTQRDTDAKDVPVGAMISVIYAHPKGEDAVLLTGVVEPSEK